MALIIISLDAFKYVQHYSFADPFAISHSLIMHLWFELYASSSFIFGKYM